MSRLHHLAFDNLLDSVLPPGSLVVLILLVIAAYQADIYLRFDGRGRHHRHCRLIANP